MIIIKSQNEIDIMRKAGEITAIVLEKIKEAISPGITTGDLDRIAEEYIRSRGAVPSFKGYAGMPGAMRFPASICASVNSEVVHGIPGTRRLEEGDIISIDIDNYSINVLVSDEELAKRRAKWKPRKPKITTGYLARYTSMVTSGNRGAILEVPKTD
mgnify:CR=1 FL=1